MKTLRESILDGIDNIMGQANNAASEQIQWMEAHKHPKNNKQLKDTIKEYCKMVGWNADLNWIDVSKVENMGCMFEYSMFNGDISKWNVSNVKDMNCMFYNSKFNGDISKWDTSNVEDMNFLFYNSQFNGDISKWDVRNVKYMSDMFKKSPLEKNPPKWHKD